MTAPTPNPPPGNLWVCLYFDFKDLISEVEYTLKLAQNGTRVAYIEDLRVYESIDNFDYRIPSLSKRFGIFWNNIFKQDSWFAREFLISLVAPNWWKW